MSDVGANDHEDRGCPPLESLERVASGEPASDDLTSHLASCDRCSALLAEIRSNNDLIGEFMAATDHVVSDSARAKSDAIPGYELIEELHRGGQGVVYKARQLSAKRTVAVKMLLHGAFATSAQRGRFEREVELVAQLRHPGIVTLYENGRTSDGLLYLAMEYVDGERLDAYVNALTETIGRAAPVRQTLELFARICDAVGYAHQRGVIHRDLKPGNILVDESGSPHVLDFGIAKAADSGDDAIETTATGEFVGTFAYAAPEQVSRASGDVDIRTDVYALGVLLYEMLTQQRPYVLGGSVADIVSTILESAPTPPRRVRRDIPVDVETIVLKALSKDPARRYQSARNLGEDVRNYLDGSPINARRDSAVYVIRKTLWKHKIAAGVGMAFLTLIVVSAITMTVLFLSKSEEARRANRALGVIVEGLTRIDQESSNVRVSTIDELLLQFEDLSRDELSQFPDMRADVETALGLAFIDKRNLDDAIQRMRTALNLQMAISDVPRPKLANAHKNLGRALWRARKYEEAEREFRTAREVWRNIDEPDPLELATTTQFLGSALENQNRFEEATAELLKAESMYRGILPANHPLIANTLNSLGICFREQGLQTDSPELRERSYKYFHEALGMLRATLGPNDLPVARLNHSVGTALLELGRLDEAEQHLLEALRIKKITRANHPWEIARTHYQLASLGLRRSVAQSGPERRRSLQFALNYCIEAVTAQREYLEAEDIELEASERLLDRIQDELASANGGG